jgi:hypothetical protein
MNQPFHANRDHSYIEILHYTTTRNTIPTHASDKQLLYVLPAVGDEPQRESRDGKERWWTFSFKPKYDEAEKSAGKH